MTLGLSPVPPRMQAMPQIPQDVPVYRLKAPCFLDDDLYGEGEILSWPEEPNLEMEPMNELASVAFSKYLEKLDAEGEKVAKQTGKSYTGYKDAYENSLVLAQQDSKKVHVIKEKKMAPLMGAKRKKRAEKVEITTTAPLTGAKGKLAVGKAAVNAVSNKGLI